MSQSAERFWSTLPLCREPVTWLKRLSLLDGRRSARRFSLRLGGPFVLQQLAPARTLPGSLGLAGRLLLPVTAFNILNCNLEYRSMHSSLSRCSGHQQNLAGGLAALKLTVGLHRFGQRQRRPSQ